MGNQDIAISHGLTEQEYKKIVKFIGREPNYTEIGIMSAMWSEHCSYKSSRIHLKRLPTTGDKVIQGPGENAGIVDIGDGLCAVFKMESHNHPSFIEPYQGAATGVGGILRDIFTMGARPIALLDSLRFGNPRLSKTKYLVEGVVSGIAGYGNCIGIPTIGGEIYFNSCYDGNPLVNVFALGITKTTEIFRGYATGVGNPVFYVGSKTGRDGIHGAVMASETFTEESEEKRPAVQVGDPFTEKLLLEACLELFKTDAVVGIQDMGAAGLTSSSTEMAERAETGIEIDVNQIPCREKGMTPYEMMLSESQERMLIVLKQGKEHVAENIFKKWNLDSSVIGNVIEKRSLILTKDGSVECDLPVDIITNEAPYYDREYSKPEYLSQIKDSVNYKKPDNFNDTVIQLLSSPNLCNKNWVIEQYDHMVRTNTVCPPGSDASIVRIKGTDKSIAMTTNCNSKYCYLTPYTGSMIAVAESARNLACSGAVPLAITDCLNFGNPENPEIMWQFKESINGISKAATFLGTPIVSGNVSLYNQTGNEAIYPTPTIGMVGLIEDSSKIINQWFKNENDLIIQIGNTYEEFGGSEFLNLQNPHLLSRAPELNLESEKKLINILLELIQDGILNCAHDISEGGLITALAESCFTPEGQIGIKIENPLPNSLTEDAFLFSESQSRVIVSLDKKKLAKFEKVLNKHEMEFHLLGTTGGDSLVIENLINMPVKEAFDAWDTGFIELLKNNG
ncbi:MAG TPA: phosphoribosylformylglycinamidine synthase subunit PurL [Thermodesulfobacteriota bacterium]|nr:phosphoribosylformylglycinamidine synthase subunit PurL [Thermodesulfobacteriota bacterium]